VTPSGSAGVGDERLRRSRIDDVGEQNDERATRLTRGQEAKRRRVVGFSHRRIEATERGAKTSQRCVPALRDDE